jgi:DNA primase
MSQIDEIKSRIDIVDLIGETVKLRRTGKNYSGLCPFHNEKTPSFIVSPDRQTWRCFGQCNEGGDIFKFAMKKEGWDFKEALRALAERAGVKLEAYKAEKPEEKEAHERLRGLLEEAVTFYRYHLSTPDGKFALEYIRTQRHLTDATIETFGLGYAPQGWDTLLKHFTSKGYAEQELLDTGLIIVHEEEHEAGTFEHRRAFDRFRNRLMIPIRDENGRMTGFGARILDPQDFPKFMNSPETVLFSKSRLLYGLDRARKPIRAADQAVIVEGYLDVIAVHQAGFENVVSPMGTALTEEQLRLLKRFSRRIVLALDPDAAGQKAVLGGLEAARQSLDRADELRFDAHGLLRHEARLQADLRVASMPDDLDPDEIVQRDPQQWKGLIENAKPVIEHVMTTLAIGRDLDDPKVVSEIGDKVWPLIQDLTKPEEREFFTQRLARFLKVDERAFIYRQTSSPSARRPGVKTEANITPPESSRLRAPLSTKSTRGIDYCLGVLLRRPELLFQLDRLLGTVNLRQLNVEDFNLTDYQILFTHIKDSTNQDALQPTEYIMSRVQGSLDGLVNELLLGVERLDTIQFQKHIQDRQIVEELFRIVISVRIANEKTIVDQLRFMLEDAQQEGLIFDASYSKLISDHIRLKDALYQVERKLNNIRSQG